MKRSICWVMVLVAIFATEPSLSQNFTKDSTGVLTQLSEHSRGGNWGDYNNDGYEDLYVTNGFFSPTLNYLYLNNGDGSFMKITSGAIANDIGISRGSAWGDYNNDGHLDLHVARSNYENRLYLNNGDSTFTSIDTGDIVDEVGYSYGTAWGDYDNDGWLDLYVANIQSPSVNYLHRNNGDGTFTRVLNDDAVNESSNRTVDWIDYDGDCDLDLFAVHDIENNLLFQNNGDGSFTKVVTGEIANDPNSSFSSSWGDYDNDGDLDVFISTRDSNEPNFLYSNNNDGTFTNITSLSMLSNGLQSKGSAWGDYDNDGDLDLYITNTNGPQWYNSMYSNNGDGTFDKVTSGIIVNDPVPSVGCSFVDIDNDGDLDLFVANDGNNNLYTNDGNSNNWIKIRCEGSISNKSAIGTIVRVKSVYNGNHIWQMRMVSTGSGKSSNGGLSVHFGLGNLPIIDSIIIEWPSCNTQILKNVAVNQHLSVVEDSLQFLQMNNHPVSSKEVNLLTTPNPFESETTIQFQVPTSNVSLIIVNQLGQNVATLVEDQQISGEHSMLFDGSHLPGGIYIARLSSDNLLISKKLLIVR